MSDTAVNSPADPIDDAVRGRRGRLPEEPPPAACVAATVLAAVGAVTVVRLAFRGARGVVRIARR